MNSIIEEIINRLDIISNIRYEIDKLNIRQQEEIDKLVSYINSIKELEG